MKAKCGFTLLEIVVAAAVASVAVAIASAALFGGHSLMGRVADSSAAAERALARAAALDTLRADIASAIEVPAAPAADAAAPSPGAADLSGGWAREAAFAGTGSSLRCMRLLAAQGSAAAEPVVVEWTRHPSGGVERRVSRPPFSADPSALVSSSVYPAGWGALSFAFLDVAFGPGGALGGVSRTSEFAGRGAALGGGSLPGAVQIRWGGQTAVFPVKCFHPGGKPGEGGG